MPTVDELKQKVAKKGKPPVVVPSAPLGVAHPAAPAAEQPAEQPVEPKLSVADFDGPKVLKKFAVELKYTGRFEFDAYDRLDAIEQYKKFAGVISTIHPFQVDELPAE